MSKVELIKEFNVDQAVKNLSDAIKFKTISYSDYTEIDYSQFAEFIEFLCKTYPHVNRTCRRELINDYCIMYVWKSKKGNKGKPILLLGHYDVVPVEKKTQNDWKTDPFSGEIKEGYIWGRGALDNKNQVIAIMEAIEFMIRKEVELSRDIYMIFGFDEEVGGDKGAQKAAELLEKRGISFECILDEGGCVTKGVLEGLEKPAALIGVAEKASNNLKIITTCDGGHSSIPPDHTALGKLAKIIKNLE